MGQREAVADHLRRHGGITDETAQRMGIRLLRGRVLELRRKGWRIRTCDYDGLIPSGHGHYVLVQEPGQPERQMVLPL